MERIRFLSEQIFENEGPGKGVRFAKGQVLGEADVGHALGKKDLPDGYAASFLNRWIQRGVAVDADAPIEQEEAEQPVDLSTLTRAQLDALANERGVDISDAKNKGDVIAALELAAEING